jgi:lambda family phage portal protein
VPQPVRLLGADGQPLRLDRRVPDRGREQHAIRARYDAAVTNDSNYRHWANADYLSARAANDPFTRGRLRSRSRYERANDGYFKGLIESLAHDCIGTGPRLQLTLPDNSPDQARWVERSWAAWADDEVVSYADKLRVGKESEVGDGESFQVLVTNPAVRHPVKLDLALVEADQCGDWVPPFGDPLRVDGIVFDQYGNPAEYHFFPYHPGDDLFPLPVGDIIAVPAEFVIHSFRMNRPGQRRGVPEITPALPVGAILRRYRMATLEAAEVAANIAGVMTNTGLPPDGSDPIEVEAYDKIPLERGTLLSLPDGRDAKAFEPSQPTTTYRDFKGENLDEIGRAVHAPSNVVRGNSREYNFSSGRLDYVIYHRAIRIYRRQKEIKAVNRVFRAWVDEARRVPRVLPPGLPPIEQWQWTWHWDGFESINPVDDAKASQLLLQLGLTTYSQLLAEDGQDWEEVMAQRAREMQKLDELGLPPPPTSVAPTAGPPAGVP